MLINDQSLSDSGIENQPVGFEKTANGAKPDTSPHEIIIENEASSNDHGAESNHHGTEAKKEEPFVEIKDRKKKKKEKLPSLWYTLLRCFGLTFLFGSILKLFHDCLLFVNPYILR